MNPRRQFGLYDVPLMVTPGTVSLMYYPSWRPAGRRPKYLAHGGREVPT